MEPAETSRSFASWSWIEANLADSRPSIFFRAVSASILAARALAHSAACE